MATHFTARTNLAIWIALASTGAWLLHPALTPAHVEGFSASIVSLALHLNAGDINGYDPLYPANLEFFALSRLGTVTVVSFFAGALGLPGEWAMRATMWASFAGLAAASFVLVRRWTGCSAPVAVAALLLIPGVAESAFFYNDNVLSVALAAGALAVVASTPGLAATALAGFLFGAGVVARADAVLLAPAVALMVYEQDRLGRRFVRRGLAFAAGALVPVVALPAAFDATIVDVLRISSYAVTLWDRTLDRRQHAVEFAIFVGIPAGLLALAGLYRLVRCRDAFRLLLLAGVPLVFNVVVLGKLWQSRQVLPLTPFLAALTVLGWQQLAPKAHRWPSPLARYAFAVATAVVLFAPLVRQGFSDGPRFWLGRFWSPPRWTHWQLAVNTNVDEIERFATALRTPRPAAVVTDSWNGDRYLHLALQESGFAPVAAGRLDPACAKVAELFRRGSQEVLHIRLHEPFLQSWPARTSRRLEERGTPCLRAARPTSTFLLAPLSRLDRLLGRDLPVNSWVARERLDSTYARAGYEPQVAVRLNQSAMTRLWLAYGSEAAAYLRQAPASERYRDADLAGVERLLSGQVWRPRPPAPSHRAAPAARGDRW